MAYRNKVFVSFDGDNDMHYYRLMRAWKQTDGSEFSFFDAHDINTALDSSTEETIKRKLSERLSNTKIIISLIGENTRYLYKFVRWELEKAISLGIPIIGVNLNGLRKMDPELTPPILKNELVLYVSFNKSIIQYALENWPDSHAKHKQSGENGPYYYKDKTYSDLGLQS